MSEVRNGTLKLLTRHIKNLEFQRSIIEREPLMDETSYRLLKLIENNPQMSQRELAYAIGVSLGKVNYCLRAIVARGLVKVKNFKANPNKRTYGYYLTPKGVEEKTRLAIRFLKRKVTEYEDLKQEIAQLQREIAEADLA